MDKKDLTPEEKKEIRLRNLARGRQKALETRKQAGELCKKEKEMVLVERKKQIDERLQKVKAFESSKEVPKVDDEPVNVVIKKKKETDCCRIDRQQWR